MTVYLLVFNSRIRLSKRIFFGQINYFESDSIEIVHCDKVGLNKPFDTIYVNRKNIVSSKKSLIEFVYENLKPS